jgi:hypothetical protein
MVETQPVTGFMSERTALVVGSVAVVGHSRVKEDDAIHVRCAFVVAGEGGVAEKTLALALHETN